MEIMRQTRRESLLMCWMRGEKDCGKCDEKECGRCERMGI
jgi:hypothetical protein